MPGGHVHACGQLEVGHADTVPNDLAEADGTAHAGDDVQQACNDAGPVPSPSPQSSRSRSSLAGCGDDTVVAPRSTDTVATPDTVAAPTVVLRYATTGGCVVLGPNCPTYTVWSDGTVDVSRTGVDAAPEITGHVPATEVQAWFASVHDLDATALAAQVGPGTCNSCVDGTDIVATVELPGGSVTLDSTKLAFDPADPTFAALERLMVDVRAVGALPLREGG